MKATPVEKAALLMLGAIIIVPILFFGFNALIFSDIFTEKGQEFRRGKGPTGEESEIMNVAGRYGISIGTRDYRDVNGSEGYEYLTYAFKQRLINDNEPQKAAVYYKDNQLVTNFENIKYTYLVIDKDQADIKFTLTIALKEANVNYLRAAKLTPGTIYQCHFHLKMIKENGNWKIQEASTLRV